MPCLFSVPTYKRPSNCSMNPLCCSNLQPSTCSPLPQSTDLPIAPLLNPITPLLNESTLLFQLTTINIYCRSYTLTRSPVVRTYTKMSKDGRKRVELINSRNQLKPIVYERVYPPEYEIAQYRRITPLIDLDCHPKAEGGFGWQKRIDSYIRGTS
ncbi:hypothetical protein GQR58_012044 [Nymphon striatum]|nr:hypothetical protein GQR58_012044 [Nymphon striatum]